MSGCLPDTVLGWEGTESKKEMVGLPFNVYLLLDTFVTFLVARPVVLRVESSEMCRTGRRTGDRSVPWRDPEPKEWTFYLEPFVIEVHTVSTLSLLRSRGSGSIKLGLRFVDTCEYRLTGQPVNLRTESCSLCQGVEGESCFGPHYLGTRSISLCLPLRRFYGESHTREAGKQSGSGVRGRPRKESTS